MFPFDGPYKNPLRNLYDFFRYDLPQGIENLYTYGPIILRTREWDQVYLYELMSFKLKRMEKAIRFGIGVDGHKRADEIKEIYKALDRLIKDDYIFKYTRKDQWFKELTKDLKIVANGIEQSTGWWD